MCLTIDKDDNIYLLNQIVTGKSWKCYLKKSSRVMSKSFLVF